MAKNAQMTYPLDTPRINAQGDLAPERDAPGNDSWLAKAPESAERAAKGDLGLSFIPNFESRALTSAGLPFLLKR